MPDVTSILEMAAQWGIFAAMFVSLFIYVVKENKARETNYCKIIETLGEKLLTKSTDSNEVAHSISEDIDILQAKVVDVDRKVDGVCLKVTDIDRKIDGMGSKLEVINHDISKRG